MIGDAKAQTIVLNTQELNNSSVTDPVSDKFNFTAQKEGTGQLYSAIGSLVRNIPFKKGNNRIDISSLEKGVYFVKIDGKSYKIIKK
ncbi:T9SS type A sorting domain-containing protein [Chryseobacterium bernardetii]|uniref:T9SS type A sorting domain-containing protein n=1 Tax=Chryseobacterium TaxID=59732 RepID=UPI0016296520